MAYPLNALHKVFDVITSKNYVLRSISIYRIYLDPKHTKRDARTAKFGFKKTVLNAWFLNVGSTGSWTLWEFQ